MHQNFLNRIHAYLSEIIEILDSPARPDGPLRLQDMWSYVQIGERRAYPVFEAARLANTAAQLCLAHSPSTFRATLSTFLKKCAYIMTLKSSRLTRRDRLVQSTRSSIPLAAWNPSLQQLMSDLVEHLLYNLRSPAARTVDGQCVCCLPPSFRHASTQTSFDVMDQEQQA